MLRPSLRIYVLASLMISASLIACKTVKPTFDTLLKHQSATQTLVVRNELSQVVELIAAGENLKALQLSPGEAKEIQFVVFTTMHLETTTNRYWLKAQAETEGNLVEESAEREFLPTEGDVTLTVKLSDSDFRKYQLYFGDCWFDTAAAQKSHEIIITDNEEEDIREAELCP